VFTITGTVQGRTVTLRWEDEVLSGDQVTIDKARYENSLDHGYLGTAPSLKKNDYLTSELPANCLLKKCVFDSIVSEENDWEPYVPGGIY